MKKIFTLITLACLALGANAQLISWTADDKADAGTLNEKVFSKDNFSIKITDEGGKLSIDENPAYFGTAEAQQKFTARLKSGGKSSSKNHINVTIPAAGTLKVYLRTGSNSATDRNLVLTQGETELYNKVILESDAVKVTGLDEKDPTKETNVYPIISVEVAAGEVAVTYPTGSLNFYGFEFVAGGNTSNDTWTVAGGSSLMGADWNPAETNNDMTSSDGIIYTLVKEDVVLEKDMKYEFKVVKNHAWGEEYPSSNYVLTVDETAKYKVTITFNAESKDVNAEAVKTGEAGAVEHTWGVVGSLVGSWDADFVMTKGNDGIYTAVIENVKAGNYEFKVRADGDWSINFPSANYMLTVEQDGSTVTVTFDPSNKSVNATVAGPTGISSIKAGKTNAVRYNLAGQQVDANFKGLVIENGKKMILK